MAEAFDPYHKWLGIASKDQPPNHYRLLGIDLFESDPDVISAAADQRMGHVRAFQTGENSALSQKVLNEISAARVCLLRPQKKREYDAWLRELSGRHSLPARSVKAAVDLTDTVVAPVTTGRPPFLSVPPTSSVESTSLRNVSGRKRQSWHAVAALAIAAAFCAGIVAIIVAIIVFFDKPDASPDTARRPAPESTGPPERPTPASDRQTGARNTSSKTEKPSEKDPNEGRESGDASPKPKVVPVAKRLEELQKSLEAATGPEELRDVTNQFLALLGASRNSAPELAKQVAIEALRAARRAHHDELVKQATLRYYKLDTSPSNISAVSLPLEKAIPALDKNPVHRQANLVLGRELCFVKGDWKTGVPMLTLGGDASLSVAAVKELEGATTPRQQEELAELWREAAQREDGNVRQALLLRSVFCYEKYEKAAPEDPAVELSRRTEGLELPSGRALTQKTLDIPQDWLANSFPNNAPTVEVKHPNQEVRAVATFRGTKIDGIAATFDEGGQLESLGRYDEADLDGVLRLWNKEGHRHFYGEYTKGNKNGLTCLFREDVPWYIQEWDNGALKGGYLVKWTGTTPVVISTEQSASGENKADFETAADQLSQLEKERKDAENLLKQEIRGILLEDIEAARRKGAAVRSRAIRDSLIKAINTRRAERDRQIGVLRRLTTPR